MKNSILTLAKANQFGGENARLYRVVKELLKRDFEIFYISTSELPLEKNEKLHPSIIGIPFAEYSRAWFSFCFFVKAFVASTNLLLGKQISSVVVVGTMPGFVTGLSALLTRKPHILFLRSTPWLSYVRRRKFKFFRVLEFSRDYLALLLTSQIIVPTKVTKNKIEKRFPSLAKKITVLPFNVDLAPALASKIAKKEGEDGLPLWLNNTKQNRREFKKEYNVPPKSIVMITSGALTQGKSLDVLIRAMSAAESENLFLIICGEGPEKKHLMSIAYGLGLTNEVTFVGEINNPLELIASCDLFILPSSDGVISNSLFEALSVGVPVLASNIPEFKEILVHEELLFDNTHVGSLAAQLSDVLQGSLKLRSLQECSFERVKELNFDWGEEVQKIIAAQK